MPYYNTLIEVSTCTTCSYLEVELWDVNEMGLGAGDIIPSLPRAQPLLVMARGSIPLGYYNMTAGTWAFSAQGSVSDVAGQDLLRPYLQVYCFHMSHMYSAVASQCQLAKGCYLRG